MKKRVLSRLGCFVTSFSIFSSLFPVGREIKPTEKSIFRAGDPNATVENSHEEEESISPITIIDPNISFSLPDSPQNFNPTYEKYYFKNLIDNLPPNIVGNCGYVAISMLMGFYDSFVNDNFVPEKYDKTVRVSDLNDSSYTSSPCVKDKSLPDEKLNDSNMNYINEKIATADTSFIGYLYKLAKETLGSKMTDATMDDEKLSAVLDTYINHQEKIKNIVKAEKILVKTEKGSPLIGNTNPEIRQYIINKVSAGIPVIIGGDNVEQVGGKLVKHGHICIAYEYDANRDIIYCNKGYQDAADAHCNAERFFNGRINTAISLLPTTKIVDPNSWHNYNYGYNHSHSNNYLLNEGSVYKGICSCVLASHICTYIGSVSNRCYCLCPCTLDQHEKAEKATYISLTKHAWICKNCGRVLYKESHKKDSNNYCSSCGVICE